MKHIIIANSIGAACDDFSVRVCNAVYGALGRPFDLDFGVMVPADRRPGEPDSYWYEIHPEIPSDDEFYTIEPDGLSEESRRIFAVLKPIFEEIGATEADPAVGQEFSWGTTGFALSNPPQ